LAADGGREGNFGRHLQQLLENGRFSGGGFAIRVAGIIEAQSFSCLNVAAQPGWIFGFSKRPCTLARRLYAHCRRLAMADE
jgi:hypothetical protein